MKMQWSIVICGATTIEVDKVKRTKRRLPATEMYLNKLISYVKDMEVKLIKVTDRKYKKVYKNVLEVDCILKVLI